MSTRWRPIASAPQDGTRILILVDETGCEAYVDIARFSFAAEPEYQWQSDDGLCYVPKLWMPLPSVKNNGNGK